MRHPVGPRTVAAPQRGAIAVLALILLPILIGFGALLVDLGRLFVFKTEIQNAMDACALAATSPLTGVNDPNIFDVARAHGKATMDASKVGAAARDPVTVNTLHFQRDAFSLGDVVVEFSSAISGQPWIEATSTSHAGITPQAAKFVRCTYHDNNNTLFFAPVLRVVGASVAATAGVAADAIATLDHAQSVCAFPAAVCIDPTKTATSTPPWGLTAGERKVAVNNPGSGYGTGNFGWLDFTPPAGGASELRALIQGAGSCNVVVGQHVGQPGVVNSLETAWNTRFGVYASSVSPSDGAPDFTGYGYASGGNHYADYETRQSARERFQGNVGGSSSKITSAQHAALGQKRRVVTAALVDCSVWSGGHGSANPPVLDFACVLLEAPVSNSGSAASWSDVSPTIDVEYLGLAADVGTPCASAGLGGGTYGPLVPVLSK